MTIRVSPVVGIAVAQRYSPGLRALRPNPATRSLYAWGAAPCVHRYGNSLAGGFGGAATVTFGAGAVAQPASTPAPTKGTIHFFIMPTISRRICRSGMNSEA